MCLEVIVLTPNSNPHFTFNPTLTQPNSMSNANPNKRYRVRRKDFEDNHGNPLLAQHNDSFHETLTKVFSEHTFLPFLFHFPPRGYFRDRKNLREYIDWLKKRVGVERDEELTTSHYRKSPGGYTSLPHPLPTHPPSTPTAFLLLSFFPFTFLLQYTDWEVCD